MPRYYFNYFDGHQTVADVEGQDLECEAMAIKQGNLHARDRVRDLKSQGKSVCDESVEVVSESGDMLVVIPISVMTDDVDC